MAAASDTKPQRVLRDGKWKDTWRTTFRVTLDMTMGHMGLGSRVRVDSRNISGFWGSSQVCCLPS